MERIVDIRYPVHYDTQYAGAKVIAGEHAYICSHYWYAIIIVLQVGQKEMVQ
jgi:hypothetical protein